MVSFVVVGLVEVLDEMKMKSGCVTVWELREFSKNNFTVSFSPNSDLFTSV